MECERGLPSSAFHSYDRKIHSTDGSLSHTTGSKATAAGTSADWSERAKSRLAKSQPLAAGMPPMLEILYPKAQLAHKTSISSVLRTKKNLWRKTQLNSTQVGNNACACLRACVVTLRACLVASFAFGLLFLFTRCWVSRTLLPDSLF